MIDSKLLDILVCPITKGPLKYDKTNNELVSKSARLAYPIRDGIPVLLEQEARELGGEKEEPSAQKEPSAKEKPSAKPKKGPSK